MLANMLFLLSNYVVPYQEPHSNNLQDAIFIGAFVAIALIYTFIKRLIINWPHKSNPNDLVEVTDTSLLLTMYTNGVGLTEISNGLIGTYQYVLSMTSPIDMEAEVNNTDSNLNDPETMESDIDDSISIESINHVHPKGELLPIAPVSMGTIRTPLAQMLVKLVLPVKSQAHIAGFSLKDDVFKQLLGNTNMDNMLTQVSLEGNFPDYFKLYSGPGQEIELREVLDPSIMQFLVDFCERINWELFEDTLYFVESATTPNLNSKDTIIQASEDFVSKVLPILQRMNGQAQTVTGNTDTPTLA